MGEQQNVRASLPKWRQLYRHDREAMIEILTESPGANGGAEVLAGGRQYPCIGGLGPGAPQTPDRVFLERLEQLGLQRVRHEPDLVEEDRAAMRNVQQPCLRLPGVGECATLEPEELGFEQRVRNRRAVHVDECPLRSRTHLMDHVRDESFAGSGLTLYQHRRQTFRRDRRARE